MADESDDKNHLKAIAEAAHHIAALLPASGPGLTWTDVVEDNGLAGAWAPDPANLQQSVRALLLGAYQRQGTLAAAKIIDSAARLASLRHGRWDTDQERLIERLSQMADLAAHVSLLGGEDFAEKRPVCVPSSELWILPSDFEPLRRMFERLRSMENRQAAGLLLERLLWRLLYLYRLQPGEAFRVEGQQIDGSFKLDGSLYLLEAKWTTDKLGGEAINWFDKKVRSKSRYTRGLLVSVNGYTEPALKEYRTNSQPAALLIDGAHLEHVLHGKERLPEMLTRLSDHFDRTGEPYLPVA
jgi:Restriction endonuclease